MVGLIVAAVLGVVVFFLYQNTNTAIHRAMRLRNSVCTLVVMMIAHKELEENTRAAFSVLLKKHPMAMNDQDALQLLVVASGWFEELADHLTNNSEILSLAITALGEKSRLAHVLTTKDGRDDQSDATPRKRKETRR